MRKPKAPLRPIAGALALVALLGGQAASAQRMDATNPTCPAAPNWSNYSPMRFTLETRNGTRVLMAEGQIDEDVPERLQAALAEYTPEEIWLRSPGGNARAGNQAGFIIRQAELPTRIPAGWACFSACNFMFMGGVARFIDRGGLFIVHMFTQLSNGSWARQEIARGGAGTVEVVSNVEQGAALLATEDNDFLIRMGISRRLLTEVMYQQRAIASGADRSTRRCLTQAEVVEYNVAEGSPPQIEEAPQPRRASQGRQTQSRQTQREAPPEPVPDEEEVDPK